MSLSLVRRFQDYGAWRQNVATRIGDFRAWLDKNELSDGQTDLRLTQVLERLSEDKLTIAFVAEFSRGKSELINSIFFAEYGRRLLPSSAGRTTMCPTELQWDPKLGPTLQLLPIETRATHATTSEFKRFPEEWKVLPLDITSSEALANVFQKVRETKLVPTEDARNYGLFLNTEPDTHFQQRNEGMVEIPCWRHAIINFPHPLLEQGLVILDTPGLNAIGTEPELTLNLLPSAHAVLFILALDTGVSQTDVEVWRDYVQASGPRGRCAFAVLNKIDSLWDGLRTEPEIEAEIQNQVAYCAETLEIEPHTIFPVSAQRGLVAKINGNQALLERSRLPTLEHALSANLIPRRLEIVRDSTRGEIVELMQRTASLLEARAGGVNEQLSELLSLRGKNLNVVDAMMRRVRIEKQGFENGLVEFQALRKRFSDLSNALFTQLGLDALNEDAKRTLEQVRKSRFTPGVRSAMQSFFGSARDRLDSAAREVVTIHKMMTEVYQGFESTHGLRLGAPPPFSLLRYQKEFDRLERLYQKHFDTLYTMLTNEALTLLQKFFETIATQIRKVFAYANRETDVWLRAIMAPMETQIREHQIQLRRRLESVKRIHESTETLEARIRELEQTTVQLSTQIAEVDAMADGLQRVLSVDDAPMAAAA